MTRRDGAGWTHGTGLQGVERGPGADEDPLDDDPARSEFRLWRVYDAGGPVLCLKVRYRDDVEVPGWQDGPDLATALQDAERQGWHAFDREPGDAPCEYVIYHLKRTVSR